MENQQTVPDFRATINTIIEQEKTFFSKNGTLPKRIVLPMRMAYSLCGCGLEELGSVAWEVWIDGVAAFTKHPLHGMTVQLGPRLDSPLELSDDAGNKLYYG